LSRYVGVVNLFLEELSLIEPWETLLNGFKETSTRLYM
jgi:hypothetical protein